MTDERAEKQLPPEIESLIAKVLESADLSITEERSAVEAELRAHFEDGLAKGKPPQELVSRFGDPVKAGSHISTTRKEAAVARGLYHRKWWKSASEWWYEVYQAARRLGRAPGFAGMVILTLGLGVGANTAIFTVLNAVLLEELPYAAPERLVRVYETNAENPGWEFIRAPVFAEWRSWSEVFDELGALYTYREVGADLTSGSTTQRITVMQASAGYFETLGVAPIRGRTFHDEESFGPGESDAEAGPDGQVVVLAHHLWASHFGADADVLGSTVELNGVSFEVVGVMPRGFNNPIGTRADVWVPQDLRPGGSNSFGNYYLSAVGRLREGLALDVAQERLKTLAHGFAETEPRMEGDFPQIVPLQADIVGPTRRSMLLILAGAAGLVLLTACVNVANLLFARGLAQDRTLALRRALGSGRGRLAAGILTENGLLALGGGALGLLLGWAGMQGLTAVAPEAVPAVAELTIGTKVFAFTFGLTALALVVSGLTPALRLSSAAPSDVLRSGDRSSTVGRTARKLRDAMVVLQVAVALVLVAGAMLLTRSFGALVDVPLGIASEGVLTFEVHLPTARYPDRESRDLFHREFHDRVGALPQVATVGAVSWLPANGTYHTWGFYWDPDNPDGSNDDAWYYTDVRIVAGDYLGAMGIGMVRGTDPSTADPEAESLAWINETTAAEVFGTVDPVGQQIYISSEVRRVAGIVEDVPHDARGSTTRKTYMLHGQADSRNWALIQTVRGSGDLVALREAVRDELRKMDPQLILYRPRPLTDFLGSVRASDRFATVLMASFAVLALVLALVGTYGVLAGSVAGRTREFGIRMALGAGPGDVRSMVLRYAAVLTVPGVLLGVAGAWVGSRWLEALLFEVTRSDPATYGLAVMTFLAVGFVSAWLPAARATRVDTVETLSAE